MSAGLWGCRGNPTLRGFRQDFQTTVGNPQPVIYSSSSSSSEVGCGRGAGAAPLLSRPDD